MQGVNVEKHQHTAHVGQISRRTVDKPPSRIQVKDYVLDLAHYDAVYGGLKLFGCGCIPLSMYLNYINPDAPIFALMGLVGLFLAGFGHYGQKRVETQSNKFDDATRVYETSETEDISQPIPQPSPRGEVAEIAIAGLDGEIVKFTVPSAPQWRQLLRNAMKDQTSSKHSLGKNDAVAAGFSDQQWRVMFNQFVDREWVRERKNQKPIITATGGAVFKRYLNHFPPANTGGQQ